MTASSIAAAIRELSGLIPERKADIERRAEWLAQWGLFLLQTRGKQAPDRMKRMLQMSKGKASRITPLETERGKVAPARFRRVSKSKSMKEIKALESAAKRLLKALNGLSADAFGSLAQGIDDHNRKLPADASDWVRVPHLLMLRNQIGILHNPILARAKLNLDARPPQEGRPSKERGLLLAALAAREMEFFTGKPARKRSKALLKFTEDLFAVFGCGDSAENCVRLVVECIERDENPIEKFGGGAGAGPMVKTG